MKMSVQAVSTPLEPYHEKKNVFHIPQTTDGREHRSPLKNTKRKKTQNN